MLPEDSHLAPCSNKSRPVLPMFNVCVCWIWKVAAVGKRLPKKRGVFRVKITSNVREIYHWMWAKWLYTSSSTSFYDWSVISNDIFEEIGLYIGPDHIFDKQDAFMDCVSLWHARNDNTHTSVLYHCEAFHWHFLLPTITFTNPCLALQTKSKPIKKQTFEFGLMVKKMSSLY